MDIRVVKTRKAIANAFIVLRSKKNIEKITIKELCALAEINKATFYQHYHDIYDLSDHLEQEVVDTIIKSLPKLDIFMEDPATGASDIIYAILAQKRMIDLLFADNRIYLLRDKLEKSIKSALHTNYPDLLDDIEKDVTLTFLIQGAFDAYFSYPDADLTQLIEIISSIAKKLIDGFN